MPRLTTKDWVALQKRGAYILAKLSKLKMLIGKWVARRTAAVAK